MNASSAITMNYEQLTMNYANKNKPNSKPILSAILSGDLSGEALAKTEALAKSEALAKADSNGAGNLNQ